MIPRYRTLSTRIQTEMIDVGQAAGKALEAYHALEHDEAPQGYLLDSVALNLHGFYSGLERIFEWIARELDGGLPGGSSWHRDLLAQMALALPGVRPPVIGRESAQRLEEFLRFRHLVRNLYTWKIEADKLSELVAELPRTLSQLEEDLARFERFLTAASIADEIEDMTPPAPDSSFEPGHDHDEDD